MTRRHYTKFKYENFCEIKISVRSKLEESFAWGIRNRAHAQKKEVKVEVEVEKQEQKQHTHTYYQLGIYMYSDNIAH